MPRAGFERAIPTTKRPQTYVLDRAATGIGRIGCRPINKQHTVIVAGASPHLLHADAAGNEMGVGTAFCISCSER
jgi:hypothetical protein